MYKLNDLDLENLIKKNQVVISKKQKRYIKIKQLLDFMISFIALIILSPILLIVSILIKLDSPHEKILFKQERIGQHGKVFTLYKFRSMKQGAPELSTSEFTNANQYITRIGRLLRKTSIDELPQLWCVLCGKMSIVGVRPLILGEDEVHFLREYYGIYQLKPGITGLAQINGRDTMEDYDKVWWDRKYVRNFSFLYDVKILWKTIMKVIKGTDIIDEEKNCKVQTKDSSFEVIVPLCNEEYETIAK